MRKATLILTFAFAMASTAMAVATEMSPGKQRAHLTPTLRKAMQGMPTRADEMEVISQQPEGTAHIITMRGAGHFQYNEMEYVASYQDRASEVVEGDDGFFYLKDPVSQLPMGSYIKGKREGDKVVFTFPQLVFEESENGYLYQYFANRLKIGKNEDGTNWMFLDENSNTITFEFDGEEWIMESPDAETVLGLTDEYAQWTGFGDEDMVFSYFTEEPNKAPETDPLKWALTYNGDGRWTNIWIDGDNVSIEGMFRMLPDAVVKGKINGDKVFFPSQQYLGICNGYHAYFMGVKTETQVDPYGKENTVDVFTDGVTFDYDAENEIMLYSDQTGLTLNSGAEYVGIFEIIRNAKISAQKKLTTFVPVNPYIVSIEPVGEEYPWGEFFFNIPMLNVANELIDADHMYYSIWRDGEIFPIEPNEFTDHEVFTQIPYNFTDEWDIWVSDIRHCLYFYDDNYERMGVQSIYKADDGTDYKSEVVYIKNPLLAVESIEDDNNVTATEWYDMSGLRVLNPAAGIYVVRLHHGDGNVTVKKVVRK